MNEVLDSYIEYCELERKLSPRTVDSYSRDLTRFFQWLEERGSGAVAADTGEVADYLSGLSSSGMAASSVRRVLSSIRGFYRYLQSSGTRKDHPAELLHPPKQPMRLPHSISLEQVTAMIEVWKGDTTLSLRNRALMELAYGAGLRESEITGMTVGRVMLEEELVRPMGKGSKERLVPIGPEAVEWLKKYIDIARPELLGRIKTPVLFLTYRGNPLSRMTVWNVVRKSAVKAGVPGRVHPHTLRHSFATHLLKGGADLRVVQELLGHSDIKTTEIYTDLDRTHLRNVIRRCHPRSGGL